MQNDNIFIEYAPKEKDIVEIITWLKEEYDKNGESFYSNSDRIYEAYHSGTAFVLKYESKNIGLATWNADDILVNVNIFVLKEKYRGQGYGSFFFKKISDFYNSEGYKVVELFCRPESSEQFWIKMGLQKFSVDGIWKPELSYFKILVDTASTSYINNSDLIELWDIEAYQVQGEKPKWVWYIERKNEELIFPIIHPSNCNWKLRWSRKDKVIREDKIKYFTDVDFEIYSDSMLYIKKLSE